MLVTIYSKVVHWKKYAFMLPFGKADLKFVSELARLFNAFAQASALEAVAMKAITVMQIHLHTKRGELHHAAF